MAFEGIVGTSFQGDIAIDDILVVPGVCEEEGSCDFEQANLCGFYNTREEDDFDWTLNQGPTFSANTGYDDDWTST